MFSRLATSNVPPGEPGRQWSFPSPHGPIVGDTAELLAAKVRDYRTANLLPRATLEEAVEDVQSYFCGRFPDLCPGLPAPTAPDRQRSFLGDAYAQAAMWLTNTMTGGCGADHIPTEQALARKEVCEGGCPAFRAGKGACCGLSEADAARLRALLTKGKKVMTGACAVGGFDLSVAVLLKRKELPSATGQWPSQCWLLKEAI